MTRKALKTMIRQALALTKGNLKSRYRSTWSGFLWVVMFPILIYSAQSFAFHYILKIDIQNYPLFLLAGLLPWTFISSSVDMSTGAFVTYGKLLKSFPIHPGSVLFSQIADNFLNYSVAFVVLLLPIGAYLNWPFSNLIYLPLPLVSLFLFVVGLSFGLAMINVFFRDTRFIMSFILQVSFFLTPIFYPRDLIPAELQWICTINPIYHILAPFQGITDPKYYTTFWSDLGLSILISTMVVILATMIWRAKRNDLYYRI